MRHAFPTRRLRYLTDVNPPVPDHVRLAPEAEYRLLPMEAIREFSAPDNGYKRPAKELLSGYSYIEPTDVAYAKVTPCFENGKGLVGADLDEPVFATTEVTVLRPRDGVNQKFLSYVVQSAAFRNPAVSSMTGAGGLKGVSEPYIKDLTLPAPSAWMQQQIADYLDHETAEIDAFITDQNRLIHLLQEREQSNLIGRTAGDEPPPDKDGNSIPWAPSRQTPYSVTNIRRVAAMKTGHTPSRSNPEYWTDTHIPWFTLADVWQLRAGNKYLGATKDNISERGLANSAAELLPTGTVVLSRTASVGFTGIMPVPMATSQDFWNWVCGPQIEPEYLWIQFRAMRQEFDRLKSGSTHKTIYQYDAAGLGIVLPEIEQQRRIITEVSRDDLHAESVLKEVQRSIDLARERRAALITAAVTGQIDVTAKHKPAAEQLEDDIAQGIHRESA